MSMRMMKMTAAAVCLLAAALTAGTAAGFAESGYPYGPGEIMYLAGVERTAYRDGLRYSLYDVDRDGIPELFILDDGAEGQLDVYRYDPAENEARPAGSAAHVTEVYPAADGSGFLTETDDAGTPGCAEYVLSGGAPEKMDAGSGGAGCFAGAAEDRPESLSWAGNGGWADGSVIGVASRVPDPGPENDFYLSSNYEWLSASHVRNPGEVYTPLDELEKTVSENRRMMFDDREKYRGADIRRVRDFYDTATDWERRDAEGVGPVKKYLDAAESVPDLAGLTDYLTDPEKDPFSILLGITITLDEKDTSRWAAEIAEDDFSVLPRAWHNGSPEDVEEIRTDFDTRARHVLSRAGYPAEEVDAVMAGCYELEDILLPLAWPDESDEESPLYGFQPFETVAASCANFPLERLLNAYEVTGGNIHVYYPGYLKKLDELYTEENVPMLKAYLLAHTAAAAAEFLDFEAAACLEGPDAPEEELKESLNSMYRTQALSPREVMGVASQNAYMTYFADPETRADLIGLAEEIRAAFREILVREDWLSDAGNAAALEKLDALTFSVMAPDVLIDSSYLAVDPERSFLDNYAALTVSRMKHNGAFAGRPREKGDWRYDLRPETEASAVNGYYYGCFNQFFIFAGFIREDIYRPDMPIEEKLASIGEVIGHELTHGFDPNGIGYDKDGNMVVTEENPYGWMPEADYRAFMERARKIADYFDGVRPFPYADCPGEKQWGEAAADIGGLTIGLEIARKIPGFDYDRYFRTYAALWRKQTTLDWERSDIYDEHPLNYLRINVTVRQFDEFLRTYDVREGDVMYPAPEERIRIW